VRDGFAFPDNRFAYDAIARDRGDGGLHGRQQAFGLFSDLGELVDARALSGRQRRL
jgi:hypothetical protein